MPQKDDRLHTKPVSDIRLPDHFLPSFWKTNYTPSSDIEPMCINVQDPLTKDFYLNDPRGIIRFKCFELALAVPIVYSCLITASIIWGIIKVFVLFAMWCNGHTNKDSINQIPLETLKLVLAPLLLVAAEVTLILGLFFPLNARKIFASIERLFINNYDIAHTLAITYKIKQIKHNNEVNVEEFREKFESHSSFRDILDSHIISYKSNHSEIITYEILKCYPDNPSKTTTYSHVKQITFNEKQKFILARCFQPKQEIPAKYSETPDAEEPYKISYN